MRCSGPVPPARAMLRVVKVSMVSTVALLAIGCARSGAPIADPSAPAPPAEVFALTCAHCHASGLAAAPQAGVPADWNARDTRDIDVLVERVIAGRGHMPPLGSCSWCTRAQIRAVIASMLAGAEGPEPAAEGGR